MPGLSDADVHDGVLLVDILLNDGDLNDFAERRMKENSELFLFVMCCVGE